jgi:transposase
MPRANLDIHLSNQECWAHETLTLPKAQNLIKTIEEETRGKSVLSYDRLADLIGIPARSLHKKTIAPDGSRREYKPKPYDRRKALELLRGYLPRALGWKPVAKFAKELGIHRNTVESFARKSGDPKLLMYALDKRLYISPKGERIVREQKELLDSLSHRMTLADCARSLGVPINNLTAHASQRGMKFTFDPLGRTRLTAEQVEELTEWRRQVEQQKRREDVVVDGTPYRSIIRAAEEKAKLISSIHSPDFERIRAREEGALRHLARAGGVAMMTKLGMYVPKEYAATFIQTISVTQAASMMGVTTSTIKKWKERNPSIVPALLAGKRTQGVDFPALIKMAKSKYAEEPKLIKRNQMPAVFITERIDALDNLVGISYEHIVESLMVSDGTQVALRAKRGCIPNSVGNALLRRLPECYSASEEAGGIEDDRKLHHTVSGLGPKTPLIPIDRMMELVQRVADVRNESQAHVYQEMKDFFHLHTVWPQSFLELKSAIATQEDLPHFPLGCGIYLYLLSQPHRSIYKDEVNDAKITAGDLYLHSGLVDLGIVVSSSEIGRERTAQVLFMEQREVVTVGF